MSKPSTRPPDFKDYPLDLKDFGTPVNSSDYVPKSLLNLEAFAWDKVSGTSWTTRAIISSAPVVTVEELLRVTAELRQIMSRRSHRKARINKKWHKRYEYTQCTGVAYVIDGQTFACPHVKAKIEAELEKAFA